MYEYLQIGEIVNTHGIKGEIKIIPLTDDPERFEDLDWLYIDKKGKLDRHNIESVKYLKNLVVLKLEGINTPEAGEALKGNFLLIDRKHAVQLPKDSYFICDLIGLQIEDNNGIVLGKLVNVLHTGSNDVYVARAENGREILIPALKSVVNEISLEMGLIKVTLPEGLLEDEV